MKKNRKNITYEFHTSAASRKKYHFEEHLFTISGDLIVHDPAAARKLAYQINNVRKQESFTGKLTTPGEVNALGLIHEILHYLIGLYETNVNPGVFSRNLKYLKNSTGELDTEKVLLEFINEFPPLNVYKNIIKPGEYLTGETGGKPNKEILLEEIILLYLGNNNPAAANLSDLYTDKPLADRTKYLPFIDETEKFFTSEKPFAQSNLPLIQFLRRPIVAHPYNLEGQLDFILREWATFVSEKFGKRLLQGKDLIHEDYKLFVKHGGGEKGTPPVPVYEFDEEYFRKLRARLQAGEHLSPEELLYYQTEYERFTRDLDWMPRVVMIAKNIHVWLNQLSKKYQRSITKLNEIPDEELDRLAIWNFNALWLIGVWERSPASRKIKNLTGNPEAAPSAYSLYDYIIARDLGGEEAFYNLRDRAAHRGIRMASDMVPNHTGIYSKWVIEKPYYFMQRDDPPFPSYSFNGPDLSDDDRVALRIEDKYYARTDAAVVFQRFDRYTGDTKYIYHGNDGTNMPWNDTAQLNLLIPEVRESLYQTIKHIAGLFPIIRFDAAMTLTKKHYQRLWYPIPGTGGAIPSRTDFAMTREEFDNAMPEEFWRMVVDRIKTEMPDTLLLAEAFWLMEGYFVRTLGMHRVYNSAFMHMMMKEENEKYRLLVKNTLSFNPEILKRYVNFMSNPDEETAINQFGKDDKYFGVCITMITMPGLPMFGHGQIEGFSEKYGMEYKRAYYDEHPDENLVRHHEAQIFPLMKKRYLFSHVENFEFYDFVDESGNVNESVFTYSNWNGIERALVLFNNSWIECRGSIKYSVEKAGKDGKRSKSLAEALAVSSDHNIYFIYKNYKNNLEYISPARDFHDYGKYFYLKGYEYAVLIDFREVDDTDGTYARLNDYLHGQGVQSVEQVKYELILAPLHHSLSSLLTSEVFEEIKSDVFDTKEFGKPSLRHQSLINNIIDEINRLGSVPLDKISVERQIKVEFSSIREFNWVFNTFNNSKRRLTWIDEVRNKLVSIGENKNSEHYKNLILTSIVFKNLQAENFPGSNEHFYNRYILDNIIPGRLNELSQGKSDFYKDYQLIKVLSDKYIIDRFENPAGFFKKINKKADFDRNLYSEETRSFILDLFNENEFRFFVGVNEYNGVTYFNKERFEEAADCFFTIYNFHSVLRFNTTKRGPSKTPAAAKTREVMLNKFIRNELKNSGEFFDNLKKLATEKGYKLEEVKKEFQKVPEK